jgi:MFS family permease
MTYSVLLAMGTGAIFVVTMSTVSRWFDKKRGLALGIASAGGGLGTVIMAPFSALIISDFGWRAAFAIMAAISLLVVIPLSMLLKKDPYQIGAWPDGIKGNADDNSKRKIGIKDNVQFIGPSFVEIARTKSFWLFMSIWLLLAVNRFMIFTHLVPHVTDIGFKPVEAASLLSVIGGATILGRVIMGSTADRVGRKLTALVCSTLETVSMLWLVWSHNSWMLYLFALMSGFAFGGLSPAMISIVGETFGLQRIGTILGVLEVGFGIGAAVGPTIAGLIFDFSGTYHLAFLFGASVVLVRTILIATIRVRTIE